ncbi:very-long-chain enoyl-CoA reductase-like [Clavelina lepadiformis]|uniref:very-long-chain enoyl-CoA reductase n=1 Tax=Clavelina lepadiformis TaxID=159417 RepID=A0ABP0GCG8_CLALP
MELQILHSKNKSKMCALQRLSSATTVRDIKELFHKQNPKFYPSRQSYRLEPRSKSLKDSDTLGSLDLSSDGVLYFKDLGTQLGWSTVFYFEYAGPLVLYLMFYSRLPFIYGEEYAYKPSSADVVKIAAVCHTVHYAKRLLETKFVHRFSHGTMPIRNLFKNCSYYWTFAAWLAYFINHPLYTLPMYGDVQVDMALGCFIFCELGNLFIHLALKNLRAPGSTERKIPLPTKNPFTLLFALVSCPNYTYEVGAWVSFAVMTQSLVGLLFASVGFMQMAVWALGKHRSYHKEFRQYPRSRKAIIPFIL